MNTAELNLEALLPPAAISRLAGRLTAVKVGTVASVTDEWYTGLPAGKRIDSYGFYDPATGVLHAATDAHNVDLTGVLLHEIGHALDQDAGREFYDLSGSPAFVAAWKAEMSHGQLTRYAMTDEVEGFAEFARLVYTDRQTAQNRFPACFAAFTAFGLV